MWSKHVARHVSERGVALELTLVFVIGPWLGLGRIYMDFSINILPYDRQIYFIIWISCCGSSVKGVFTCPLSNTKYLKEICGLGNYSFARGDKLEIEPNISELFLGYIMPWGRG